MNDKKIYEQCQTPILFGYCVTINTLIPTVTFIEHCTDILGRDTDVSAVTTTDCRAAFPPKPLGDFWRMSSWTFIRLLNSNSFSALLQ